MTVETTPEARRITVIALLIVLLLSALDQTVVATAMPRIVAELKGLELYAWVSTIYLLTSTVMVPIWGKLGDLYGRKSILMLGVVIFVAGSWLCGLSGEFGTLPWLGDGMTQLITFRGLQGIGGGALFTSAFAIIADLYPPRERGKLSGYFGGMFGIASLLGPVIGGALTQHGTVDFGGFTVEGWRWCFYVNLPLSALALFMIATKTPALGKGRGGKIDLFGALFVLTAFVPLLLALSWGGHDHPWTSPLVLGLLGAFAVSLLLFILVESRASEPIVPLSLFRAPAFTWANVAAFIISMSFMGTLIFLPLYLQLGLGMPATESGLIMLPMMFGLIFSAMMSGRLVTRTGRYKPFMLGGAVFLCVALFLMTGLNAETTLFDIGWRVCLLGLGLGPAQGLFALASQNAVPPEQIGVATSSAQFFRQIGGTVGAAVFGAVMTSALAVQMGRIAGPGGHRLTLDELQGLALKAAAQGAGAHATAIDPAVREAFSAAMVQVIYTGLGLAVLGLVAILFIPEIPLRATLPGQQKPHAEPVAEPGEGQGA
jgi:EmrB/QacA subfamily drug resistance transporter